MSKLQIYHNFVNPAIKNHGKELTIYVRNGRNFAFVKDLLTNGIIPLTEFLSATTFDDNGNIIRVCRFADDNCEFIRVIHDEDDIKNLEEFEHHIRKHLIRMMQSDEYTMTLLPDDLDVSKFKVCVMEKNKLRSHIPFFTPSHKISSVDKCNNTAEHSYASCEYKKHEKCNKVELYNCNDFVGEEINQTLYSLDNKKINDAMYIDTINEPYIAAVVEVDMKNALQDINKDLSTEIVRDPSDIAAEKDNTKSVIADRTVPLKKKSPALYNKRISKSTPINEEPVSSPVDNSSTVTPVKGKSARIAEKRRAFKEILEASIKKTSKLSQDMRERKNDYLNKRFTCIGNLENTILRETLTYNNNTFNLSKVWDHFNIIIDV